MIKTSYKARSNHQRCSIKNVFLKISQNSLENTCARVSFPVNIALFLRTPSFYRTPLVAASYKAHIQKDSIHSLINTKIALSKSKHKLY